jgi:hypothetical protein
MTSASTWYRPRVFVFIGVLVASVLAAGVVSILRYQAGSPLNPLESLGRDSTAEGRRELRDLRKEPVLRFRAPGTHLRSVRELPAGKDWWNALQPTEVRQLFRLEREPGEVVAAYRARGEAGGWRLVEVRCSFHLRSTSVTLTREVAGRPATLKVYGHLERPPPEPAHRGVLVSLTGEAPDRPPQSPLPAPMRQHDVHCLRNFDPGDPALVPPAVLPESPEAICGLLGLAEARRVVPAVSSVQPTTNAGRGCRYPTSAGDQVFGVFPAPEPRAYYEDERSAQDPADERFVLLEDRTAGGGAVGAWVDTRLGPVRLYGGPGARFPGLDASQLSALARLLARR